MSRVVLYVDDWGNAGSLKYPEIDCGYATHKADNGASRLHRVLGKHPTAKATCFVVPNWSESSKLRGEEVSWDHAHSIRNKVFREWIQKLSKDPRYQFELHGYSHRYSVKGYWRFRKATQEFESIPEVEVKERLALAVKIFTEVFGYFPSGFRFPGFKAGRYGEDVLRGLGIKWRAGNKSKTQIRNSRGLVNLPIGYRLNKLTVKKAREILSDDMDLFITTHIEGATPTSRIRNSVYHEHMKLSKILGVAEEHGADFVSAEEYVEGLS